MSNDTKKKSSTKTTCLFTAVIFMGVLAAAVVGIWWVLKSQTPVPGPTLTPQETIIPTETQEALVILPTATQAVIPEGIPQTREVDNMPLVYVPAGVFTMGSQDQLLENASPVHTINLSAFLIDQYEVTNAQYAAFLNQVQAAGADGSAWFGNSESGSRLELVEDTWKPASGFEQHPVVSVSWFGAQAYCEWAGGRLPTEAEWEKAARGADARTYPWGNAFEECKYANSYGCAIDTVAVGSYPEGVSPYGAYDMAGNVYEWVADWYGNDYYQSSPAENPTGPASGSERVMRGGSYYTYEIDLHTAFRLYSDPGSLQRFTGFRCAVDIEP